MITDELIKSEFIHQVVSRDMKLIYNTQEEVVTNYLNVGTGRLKNFLSRKPFELYSENQFKKVYHMRLLNYLRFLDIRYNSRDRRYMNLRRNLALYNRVVWGVLFGETQPDLLYGFSDEVREQIHADLSETLKEKD